MMRWLKKKLKAWLMEEDGPEPLKFDLEVIKNGRLEAYHIQSRCGVHLMGSPISGMIEVKLIQKNEAVDQKQFDRLWHHFCQDAKIEWED